MPALLNHQGRYQWVGKTLSFSSTGSPSSCLLRRSVTVDTQRILEISLQLDPQSRWKAFTPWSAGTLVLGLLVFKTKRDASPCCQFSVTQTNKISKFEMRSKKRNTITYTGEISNCDFALEVNSHRIPQTKSWQRSQPPKQVFWVVRRNWTELSFWFLYKLSKRVEKTCSVACPSSVTPFYFHQHYHRCNPMGKVESTDRCCKG